MLWHTNIEKEVSGMSAHLTVGFMLLKRLFNTTNALKHK